MNILKNIVKVFLLLGMMHFANAHPHAFLGLRTKAIIENNELLGFEMWWRLDELSSSDLIDEIATAPDQEYKKKQITSQMVKSAEDAKFFSQVFWGERQLKLQNKARDTYFNIESNQIVFHLKFFLAEEVNLLENPINLYTFEPTYFLDIEYDQDEDAFTSQKNCQATIIKPNVDEKAREYAQNLDVQGSGEEDQNLGKLFAQKVEFVCHIPKPQQPEAKQ